jgi:hypothetical protein
MECSSYGPEHKTEKICSIEVIVNFWELVKVGKIGFFFDKNSYSYVRRDKWLKKSSNIQFFLLSTYEIWKVLVSLAEFCFFYCKFSRFRTFNT